MTQTAVSPAAAHQAHRLHEALLIAFGVALIAFIADGFGHWTGLAAFAPPLAASLFLMVALPESAMSQPRAVVGGHLVCAILSILTVQYVTVSAAVVPVAFFLSVFVMIQARVIHAPAAATIYLMVTHPTGFEVLASPFLPGLAIIVALAMVYNRLRGHKYPRHWF